MLVPAKYRLFCFSAAPSFPHPLALARPPCRILGVSLAAGSRQLFTSRFTGFPIFLPHFERQQLGVLTTLIPISHIRQKVKRIQALELYFDIEGIMCSMYSLLLIMLMSFIFLFKNLVGGSLCRLCLDAMKGLTKRAFLRNLRQELFHHEAE